MTPRLGIVIVSVRQNRGGEAVGAWMTAQAKAHGAFDVEVLDLKAINLPMFDEPNNPGQQKYTRAESVQWSARVAPLDAFVLVTPEYNHSTPPPLVNALDYLLLEWQYKPAAFVSYGGISGGLRSVQMTQPLLNALKIVPIAEAVVLPFYTQHLDKASNVFAPPETSVKAAKTMLDELARWASALRVLRPA